MRIRKITALATAAVMIVSSELPVWAENPWGGAESTPTAYSDVNVSEDGFRYEVMEDGNIRITGKSLTDEEKKIIIPGEIDGKKVTEIGYRAFYNCTSLQEITIPEGVTSIGDSAFSWCESLWEITIPKGVTSIGNYAFEGCRSMQKIIIPDGITSIGWCAFEGCESLWEITIPKGVTSIGIDAFRDCKNLKVINVDEENENYSSVDGVLYDREYSCLIRYPQGKEDEEYNIPGTVKTIYDKAFECSKLVKAVIPNGVTSIEEGVFSGCTRLQEVNIPEGVTMIGGIAFNACISLQEITIPEGVTLIGSRAFSGCRSLQEITIPEGVIRLGEYAFEECGNLKAINVNEKNENYSSVDGVLYDKECSRLIRYSQGKEDREYIIPGIVKTIEEEAFCGNRNLENVVIPEGVTSMGYDVFFNCESLKAINVDEKNENYSSVDGVLYDKECSCIICYPQRKENKEYIIPDTVKTIGNSAFHGSKNLEKLVIGEGVTSIGSFAFSVCENLKEIMISEGVMSIGDLAFRLCGNLKAINVDEKNKNYSSVDGVLYDKECSRIIHYPQGKEDKEYIIPDTVKTIEEEAFSDSNNLEKVVIPEGVTSIGYDAFRAFGRPKEITLYGYKGTYAETYALENDFKFISVMEAGDTDIKLEYDSDLIDGTVPEGTVKLDAKELQETDAEYEKISIENLIKDETIDISAVKLKAYEIKLTDGDNKPLQPSGSITVKITCPEGYDGNVCKVYYIDGEGKATDMGAVYENGYMVFETDHFSTYIVTETELKETVSVISGDANGDGEVDIKDAVMLKKHLAGYPDLKINLTAADTTGDGEVNINDAVRLLRHLAGDTVTLGK